MLKTVSLKRFEQEYVTESGRECYVSHDFSVFLYFTIRPIFP